MRLDPVTQQFLNEVAARGGPPLHELTPAQARDLLENAQRDREPEVEAGTAKVHGGPHLRLVRPAGDSSATPVVLYCHGGGWMLGSFGTHQRLARTLADAAGATVVFIEYDRTPEKGFPHQIEQTYEAALYVAGHAEELKVDGTRMAIAGDSAGGNMAAVVAMVAQQRGGPRLLSQVLFYPVTDAAMDTASYQEFENGPWLTRASMQWFWDAYTPPVNRDSWMVSPLRADPEMLRGLPAATVITAENDVLRDEGEAYAERLSEAGVPVTAVRFLGTMHDFVLLDALSNTPAARAAIDVAARELRRAFAGELLAFEDEGGREARYRRESA